jgi:hypothetical protein
MLLGSRMQRKVPYEGGGRGSSSNVRNQRLLVLLLYISEPIPVFVIGHLNLQDSLLQMRYFRAVSEIRY